MIRRRPRATVTSARPTSARRPISARPTVAGRPVQRTAAWLPRLADSWALPPGLTGDGWPAWTRLGVIDGDSTGVVDGRGLVSPRLHDRGWSLDWWVGAEDRWHLPSRAPSVRQGRIDGAPVVETALRIPGGEAVHRTWGARGPRHAGGDEWLVVEVENRTPTPVALAWVLRPLTPERVTRVGRVVLEATAGSDGAHRVVVDGSVALLSPRRPSRAAIATGGRDVIDAVLGGSASADALDELTVGVEDPDGLVTVALLTPVPHTATARVAIPRGTWPAAGDGPRSLDGLPEAAAVARGWSAQAGRGPRIDLPDQRLGDAVAASRRSLLLAHRVRTDDHRRLDVVTDGSATTTPPSSSVRAEITEALAWWGYGDEAARVLSRWPDDQANGGGFGSPAATGAALAAISTHARVTADPSVAEAWLPEVAGAIESLGRAIRRSRVPADQAGTVARGLEAGAALLRLLGQPEAASAVESDRTRLVPGRAAGPEPAMPPGGTPAMPPGGTPATPRVVAARALVAARAASRDLGPALVELLRSASPTWTWADPEAWTGDDALPGARLLSAVAAALVVSVRGRIALLPGWLPAWWGLPIDVHDVPVDGGRISFAVRWHGDRPALLWELDLPGVDDGALPEVAVPALDPAWRGRGLRGEELLGPVAPPGDLCGPAPLATTSAAPPTSVWATAHPAPGERTRLNPAPADDHREGGGDPSGPASQDPGGSFS